MRFLADESCDFAVVRELRAAGYDVRAVVEVAPRAPDIEVLRLALDEERILLTEDRDFGRLVFAHRFASPGIVYIRFPGNARTELPRAVLELIRARGEALRESFAVVRPHRIRVIPR